MLIVGDIEIEGNLQDEGYCEPKTEDWMITGEYIQTIVGETNHKRELEDLVEQLKCKYYFKQHYQHRGIADGRKIFEYLEEEKRELGKKFINVELFLQFTLLLIHCEIRSLVFNDVDVLHLEFRCILNHP